MRFYCVELNWNFNSIRLAYILESLDLTVIRRDFMVAVAFQSPQTAGKIFQKNSKKVLTN